MPDRVHDLAPYRECQPAPCHPVPVREGVLHRLRCWWRGVGWEVGVRDLSPDGITIIVSRPIDLDIRWRVTWELLGLMADVLDRTPDDEPAVFMGKPGNQPIQAMMFPANCIRKLRRATRRWYDAYRRQVDAR